MEVIFTKTNGMNSLALVPETVEELRALLTLHGGEAYCEDCEATVEADAYTCPTCGEGIACEPEYRPVRPKSGPVSPVWRRAIREATDGAW